MKRIYIAGKISGECESPELMKKCKDKFNSYGLRLLYPPLGIIIPYTITGINYSTDSTVFVTYFEGGLSFTHGLLINQAILGQGTWQDYMKNDLAVLLTCDEIHMLPDWKDSRGAKIEHQLALDLGIKIVYA